MADLVNMTGSIQTPCEVVIHIDAPGKYVVEKTGDGILGVWGGFKDAESAAATPPFGRLRIEGTKWGTRIFQPGFYFIRCDGSGGSFKIRHWTFTDYIAIKLHGG